MSNWIDLGQGHRIHITAPDAQGLRHFVEEHPTPDGQMCAGSGTVIQPAQSLTRSAQHWVMESENPLTLSPSIECTLCGNHGFVRDSVWVPA